MSVQARTEPSTGAFLDLEWKGLEAAAECPSGLRDLLTEQGSLTEQLRQLCGEAFNVRVLAEAVRPLSTREAGLLGLAEGAPGFLREVQLCRADLPLVLACTIAPGDELGGRDRWLADLGGKALGDHVFGAAGGGRETLEIARVPPTAPLVSYAMQGAALPEQALWARRSRLRAGALEVEVMECFLPGVFECIR